jgi:hypothetical protein
MAPKQYSSSGTAEYTGTAEYLHWQWPPRQDVGQHEFSHAQSALISALISNLLHHKGYVAETSRELRWLADAGVHRKAVYLRVSINKPSVVTCEPHCYPLINSDPPQPIVHQAANAQDA